MQISEEVLAAHARLGQCNLDFLDYVRRHPECLRRSTFDFLDTLPEFMMYEHCPWPTFVRRRTTREMGAVALAVSKLLSRLPGRVFGGDRAKVARFFGYQEEHARLATVALNNGTWLDSILARPDFVYTASGLKCVELNVGGGIGGWEASFIADLYFKSPALAPFMAGRKVECLNISQVLMRYFIQEGVSKLKSRTLNLAVLLHSEKITAEEQWAASLNEVYQGYLRQLPGLTGQLVSCHVDELELRDGRLFYGDLPLHMMMELATAFSSREIYSCWFRGSLLLHDGLLAQVLSDKRLLALLSEVSGSRFLDAEEQRLVNTVIPWTRRLAVPRAHPDAASPATPEQVVADQQRLVLKPGLQCGGAGVRIGAEVEPAVWQELVEQAVREGDWVVQERVESLPYVYQAGEEGYGLYNLVWSFYSFGGSYGGAFIRLQSRQATGVVAAHQGALLEALFEVDE